MPRKVRIPATPEEKAFANMRARCLNPNHPGYDNYGGRGITVCDRWLRGGWRLMVADIGPRPSPEYSLDRVDNDGPYSPENCRWATWSQQTRNRRRADGTSKAPASAETCQSGRHLWIDANIRRQGKTYYCGPCWDERQRKRHLGPVNSPTE